MRYLVTLFMMFLMFSCSEKLLEKPENLIAKDQMVAILKDVAIVNAAKTTNMSVLREHEVDPMTYIYDKHGIDSLQFVESDKYYASIPSEYKEIYEKVEAILEKEQNEFKSAKDLRDSIRRIETERKREKAKKTKDSLQEIARKKKQS